jgi:hypothetical protein
MPLVRLHRLGHDEAEVVARCSPSASNSPTPVGDARETVRSSGQSIEPPSDHSIVHRLPEGIGELGRVPVAEFRPVAPDC